MQMRQRIARIRLVLILTTACFLLAGCNEKKRTVDPTPENLNGVPSNQFEQDDINAAESAGKLVKIYCAGAVSEAQNVGCLSHVSESDVCEQDTDGKRAAVAIYIRQTGDDSICA
jgi:hypothetical protein